MRAVVQRVTRAEVRVDGEVVGAIGRGLCVLLGAGQEDDDAVARHLAERVATLRIHADDEGRMNRDLAAVGGAVLVVSQFTLYADTSRGHRPSFIRAGAPERAAELCEAFCEALRERGLTVATGASPPTCRWHWRTTAPSPSCSPAASRPGRRMQADRNPPPYRPGRTRTVAARTG